MKRFKVTYKRFKKVWGYALMDSKSIEMDDRTRGKKHMEILIHESLHLLLPEASEEDIEEKSILLTNTLWHEKYRRIDDTKTPLQDGSL